MAESVFKILPILGLKTDVPIDDKRLFKQVGDGVFATHAVDGSGFDLMREKGSCSKGYGRLNYSSVNSQATNCLGLFYLYDGTNRNYLVFDKGKSFYLDANKAPTDISGAVTLALHDGDIYSMVQVGSHIVIADRGETTPYCWKHGDAAISKAISSGTEFKFRYLSYFAQRLFGLYSDQTNGDIDIRWTGVIPVPGTTCVFAAANQLYVPNDDPISGVAKMGENSLYVLCENSIQQVIHYPSSLTPFQIYTVVSDLGCSAPYSVVALSDRIYFYNKYIGFCEYRGGNSFPYGGVPISDPISSIVLSSNTRTAMARIVGAYIPWRRQIVWVIPYGSYTEPDKIVTYDIETGNWTIESEKAFYVAAWDLVSATTWVPDLFFQGDDGFIMRDYGTSNWYYIVTTWTEFSSVITRTEPVLDFGNPRRTDLLTEVWFDFTYAVNQDITVQWRGGDTVGEVAAASFATIGTVNANSPSQPFCAVGKSARLHQILWTNTSTADIKVNGITFKFQPGSER